MEEQQDPSSPTPSSQSASCDDSCVDDPAALAADCSASTSPDSWRSSAFDVRRQSEQLDPLELKDFLKHSLAIAKPARGVGEGSAWKRCRCCASDRFTAYRNVVGISFSVFLCLATFCAMAGLQSSVNEDLGLASLVAFNVTFIVSCFYSPVMVKLLGTKYALLSGYFGILVYLAANYYPRNDTLIIGSMIVGLGFGPMFAAFFTHVTTVAFHFAAPLRESPAYLVALFTGILSFFFKMSYLPGNLVTSVILFSDKKGDSSEDPELLTGHSSANDSPVCNGNSSSATLDSHHLYILVSVYIVIEILGICSLLLFVDNIRERVERNSSKKRLVVQYLKKPIASMLSIMVNWRMVLLAPMMLLNTLMVSVALGLFQKVYVSDCIGIKWVGFVLMVYGSASALGGFLSGRLVKCLPQYLIVYFFSFLTLGSLLFLLLYWERRPNIYFPFLFIFVFGSCEGCWSAMSPTITGVLFPDRKEAAFSVNRVWYSVGFLSGFLLTLLFPFRVVLWIVFATAALNCFTYFILTLKTQTREQLLPCCFSDKKKKEKSDSAVSVIQDSAML